MREGSRQQIGSPRSLSHALKKAASAGAHAHHHSSAAEGGSRSNFTVEPTSSIPPSSLSTATTPVPEVLAALACTALPLSRAELSFARFYNSEEDDGNEDLQVEAMTEIMQTRIREEMRRVRARAEPESAEER